MFCVIAGFILFQFYILAAAVPRLWHRTSIVDRRLLLTPGQVATERRTRQTLITEIGIGAWNVLRFLALRRLIANQSTCVACRRRRRLVAVRRHNDGDGFKWRCARCFSVSSVRNGSMFADHSHLSLKTQTYMLYEWANDTAIKDIETECSISHRTAVRFCRLCRDICEQYRVLNPVVIGGLHVVNGHVESKIVEIDETYFSRRKYNRGRYTGGVWVFGGVDRLSGQCFMEIVPRRNRQTLFPIIQQHIAVGSRIISDMWAAYRTLPQLANAYTHDYINHSLHFVDPTDPHVHTQTIEGLWNRVKRKHKRMCGE